MAFLRRLPAWEKGFFWARVAALKRLKQEVSEEIIRRGLDIGSQILVFPELPRGMELLRRGLREGELHHGAVICARQMTRAKGRWVRSWYAPKGGLWMALALYDDLLPEVRPWLPLCVGIAVTKALREEGGKVWLRWVNDVHIQGRKVAGILLEELLLHEDRWNLVGIGINVNNLPPEGLPACSLSRLLGRTLSLSKLFGRVVGELIRFYGLLRAYEVECLEEEKTENPLSSWFSILSDTPGQKVIFGEDLEQRGPEGVALAKGLDSKGGLILHTEKGTFTLRWGEVRYL